MNKRPLISEQGQDLDMFFVCWESFGWRKDNIRYTIFRARPDDGSD